MGEIHGRWFMGVGSQAGVHKPWVMGGSLWAPVQGWQRSLCPHPRMGKMHKVLWNAGMCRQPLRQAGPCTVSPVPGFLSMLLIQKK